MRIFIITFLLLGSSLVLSAQEKPDFLPEDVSPRTLSLDEFSKPGILNKSRSRGMELSLLNVGGSELVSEDSSRTPVGKIKSVQQIVFKVKIPIVNKDDLRILLGYSYRPEKYQFSSYGDQHTNVFQHLDDRWLKSQQTSLIVNKSLNSKSYFVSMVRLAFNGDYTNFFNLDQQYRIITASALYGVKKNENTEWGIGITFSSSFRRTIALPVFMYNHNFTDKLGIKLILPAVALGRWNINNSTLVLFGAEYNSRSYAINVSAPGGELQNYGMNHSEIRFPVRLEKQIHGWLWIGAQAGYQYSFSTDFDATNAAAFKVEPKSAPYFKIGLFLSPPDDIE